MLTDDFKKLITQVDKIGDGDDFITEQLLKQSGKLIYQGSLVILERAQQCLNEQLQFQIELNEGRRQMAEGRRISCRGILTPSGSAVCSTEGTSATQLLHHQQLLTAKSKIVAGALNPKVRREKEGSNPSARHALQLLPSKAEALVKEEDTIVDELFSIYLDTLCQQSINTDFLESYLQPRARKPYERNSTTTIIQNLTPVEAIAEFDLIEEVVNLAHDEDINFWVKEVERFLQGNLKINTIEQIVE